MFSRFLLIFLDITAPYRDTPCPQSIDTDATSLSGATVSFTKPTYLDTLDPTVTVTCIPESGSVFSIGGTTVECNGADSSGNVDTSEMCSFTVTVAGNNFLQKKKKN